MRLAGRQRLGFYPLPVPEAERIRRFLHFPDHKCSALDPCIGEGVAFAEITREAKLIRYGIELDACRAAVARSSADEVIHGNCFDVQCPVESFSLIYLNPPYDFEVSEERSQRMERLFLENVYRWLKRGGVLLLVPGIWLSGRRRIPRWLSALPSPGVAGACPRGLASGCPRVRSWLLLFRHSPGLLWLLLWLM